MPKTFVRARTNARVGRPRRAKTAPARFRPPRSVNFKLKPKRKLATKTRTKTKLNQKIATSKDGPVSDSYSTIPIKGGFRLGKFKKLTAPMFYVVNDANTLTWTDGIQQATDNSSMFSTPDLKAMFQMYATNIPATTTGVATTRLYMKECYSETLITNQTNDVVHMTLYDCISRRDLTSSSTAENLYLTPTRAWGQGSLDTGNSATSSIVGSTPFQTPGFTEFWKITKITNIDLHSGGHHRHKVKCFPKKQVSNEIVSELSASSSTGMLGGLSSFTMVVCHGYPVNSTGTTTVSTASGKVDWVTRKQYEFYPIGSERTIVTYSDALPVLPTESLINDLTGLATTITTA